MSEEIKTVARRQLLQRAAAFGALTALAGADLDQTMETEAAAPSLAGTWMMQVVSEGETSIDLVSFSKDGLVIDAGSIPQKAPPAGQSNGPITIGLGSWVAAQDAGFHVRFVSLGADPKGAFAGAATIDAHVKLGTTGNTLSGSFKLTVTMGSKVLFGGTGTVTGTRVTPVT